MDSVRGLLAIGWRSVRANAGPMAVLWTLALLVCVAWYQVPPVASALAVFGRWQTEYGKLASCANRIVTGGLVPGVFLCLVPSLRPKRLALTVGLQCAWSGLLGLPQDCWFAFQDDFFGPSTRLGTVVAKTLADQFGWAVFVVTPLNSLFYTWTGNGCSGDFGGGRAWFARFRRFYLVNLAMNWAVWIPVVAVIYAFPLPLQMTVSGLIGAAWALLCLKTGDVAAAGGGGAVRR
ncbi:MAG: hypothetical protein ACI4RD_08800 [Kiritimatiellia bacterium]